MEKITQSEEITRYVADDGMIFRSEIECMQWERDREDYRILNDLHSMELVVPILTDENVLYRIWYLVRNKTERSAIIRKYCNYAQYCYINGSCHGKESDIEIGDWVIRGYTRDEYDNYRLDYQGVYTLSYILNEFKQFIRNIEEITVHGKY